MSTSWTRIAGDICLTALKIMGVHETGQAVDAEEMQDALTALDTVLKELPLYGYSWPKLSGDISLTWTGQTFTLPSDFYGYPTVRADGRLLQEMDQTTWDALLDRSPNGTVSHFYISPARVLYVYPNPTEDPLLTVQYQRVTDDVSQSAVVDMQQFWLPALPYGVADELTLQFSVPPDIAKQIAMRWADKRDRALKNSVSTAPISFGVANERTFDPNNWQAGDPIPDGFDANLLP